MSDGTAISTDFHPDENTHATQNRFDKGYRFMRYAMVPIMDDPLHWRRALKTSLAILLSPVLMAQNLFAKDWEKRITAFTVMQDLDNHIQLQYKNTWWTRAAAFSVRHFSGVSRWVGDRIITKAQKNK